MRKKIRSQPTAAQKTDTPYLRHHPFIVPVTTFLVLFFLTLVGFIGFGGQTIGASDSRVVHLFVDGEEQVVPTRAKTVQDLLDRLHVDVAAKDIVEPAITTEITDSGFEVNVYRSRPVVVEDGSKKVFLETAEPTPERVARVAGITVHPEDIVEKAPAEVIEPLDAIQEGIVAERVVVDRATPISLNLYGKKVSIRTHAETVGELLTEKGVSLNQGDTVQPAVETQLTAKIQIFIVRFGTKVKQVEEKIDPPIEYVDDYDLVLGSTRIVEPGKPGKRLVTYEIKSKNGKETARTVLQEVVIKEPVKRVVARGRKAPVIAGNKAEIMAAAGIDSSEFYAADFIISHESGWRVNAMSVNGCGGLGQACPASKLAAVCPNWESDAVCQMKFFTGYAVGRYGSWTRAFEVWQLQRWW